MGAKDVRDKKKQAQANELIEKGAAEQDEETALRHFEAARKILDDENVRGLIKTTSFRRWRKSAEKHESGDWSRAADDWKRAIDFAEESQVEETRERQKFCAKFSEAVTARTSKNWGKVLELYKDLANNPHGQAGTIETEIMRGGRGTGHEHFLMTKCSPAEGVGGSGRAAIGAATTRRTNRTIRILVMLSFKGMIDSRSLSRLGRWGSS